MAVLGGVNVARGAQREEAGKKLHIAVFLLRQAGQSLQVAQFDTLAPFGLAEVDDVAVGPQFRIVGRGDAVGAEARLPAEQIVVVDGLALTGNDRADAPHLGAGHTVHVVHPELQVLARPAVERELRAGVAVLQVEHQGVFGVMDGRIELRRVAVSLRVFLHRAVGRAHLVAHALQLDVVARVEQHEGRVGKRSRHAALAHDLLAQCG